MTQARFWSRPLLPLVAALAAGIAAPSLEAGLPPAWLPWLVPGLLLLLGARFWRGRPRGLAELPAVLLPRPGACHTALHPDLPEHHVRSLPQSDPISLPGVVSSSPIPTGAGDCRLELAASAWSDGRDWQPACGLVWRAGQGATGLRPGDQVIARLTLWPVEDLSNPGASGRKLALARRQIFATGKLWHHFQPLKLAAEPSLSRLAACREQAQTFCRDLLASQPQPARSIFLALLLGDQKEISQPVRQAFNRTGATHVLSVSGFHLVILAAFFAALFFLAAAPLGLAAAAAERRQSSRLFIHTPRHRLCLAGGKLARHPKVRRHDPGLHVLVLVDRHRDVYSALTLAALLILLDSPAPALCGFFSTFLSGGLGPGLSLPRPFAAVAELASSP